MTAAVRHLGEHPERYTLAPASTAQARCPHRCRNRDNTECATCGGLVVRGRWHHLTEAWFHYYTTADARRPDT